jgi:hypothetical protein
MIKINFKKFSFFGQPLIIDNFIKVIDEQSLYFLRKDFCEAGQT